jgi:hypothetical protein
MALCVLLPVCIKALQFGHLRSIFLTENKCSVISITYLPLSVRCSRPLLVHGRTRKWSQMFYCVRVPLNPQVRTWVHTEQSISALQNDTDCHSQRISVFSSEDKCSFISVYSQPISKSIHKRSLRMIMIANHSVYLHSQARKGALSYQSTVNQLVKQSINFPLERY